MTDYVELRHWNPDLDERRGGCDYSENWRSGYKARQEMVRRNQQILNGLNAERVDRWKREHSTWEITKREHDALFGAGLRDAPFDIPEPNTTFLFEIPAYTEYWYIEPIEFEDDLRSS